MTARALAQTIEYMRAPGRPLAPGSLGPRQHRNPSSGAAVAEAAAATCRPRQVFEVEQKRVEVEQKRVEANAMRIRPPGTLVALVGALVADVPTRSVVPRMAVCASSPRAPSVRRRRSG